ncbi:hypothetical protein R80B4_02048 [Fibrobacteres bacterium R8-0-B4]
MTDCRPKFLSAAVFRRAALVIAVSMGIAGFNYAQPPADIERSRNEVIERSRNEAGQSDSTSVNTRTKSALKSLGRLSSVPKDTSSVLTDTSISQSSSVSSLSTNPSSLTLSTDTLSTDSSSAPKAKNSELADTVRYEADFIDYDNEERVLSLIGRAQVRYQNITLQADTIIYTVANDQFQALGKPQLVEGRDTTVGDFMAYNIKTRRGRVSYAFTRFDDTYVTGSNIVKTRDNHLYIEQGDYTTCQNPQHPHYYFYGRHILVMPDDKVVGRPVVMNIGDAPVAVLPYFVMPLRRGRRSGWLTPSWGGSVASGGYVDNVGYYYAPNDYVDATLAAKAQEFNSFVFNARGRYNLRYTLDGEVSGRYVIDNRLENASRQWALDYRHNQLLSPDGNTRLSGYGNLVSSSTFNQLYSDETYELEKQQLDANMSLSHRFSDINASTNLTWRRNHNLTTDKIVEDMPTFDFRLQNRALLPYKAGGSKSMPAWYNNIYYAYDTKANVRREAYGADSLKGFIRPGMEHNANVTSTQKILKYLDVSPYVNVKASMFYGAIDTLVKDTLRIQDTVVYTTSDPAEIRMPGYTLINSTPYNGSDSLYTVTIVGPVRKYPVLDTLNSEFNVVRSWNTGVNLSTRIYGLFPINALGVTAVRHTLTPSVGYSFSPKHELDRKFYNVGINYTGPRTKAEQLVTFSLSNTFQGKRIVAGRERVNNVNNANNGIISGINNGNGVSGGDSANGGIDNRVNDGSSIDIDNRVNNDGSEATIKKPINDSVMAGSTRHPLESSEIGYRLDKHGAGQARNDVRFLEIPSIDTVNHVNNDSGIDTVNQVKNDSSIDTISLSHPATRTVIERRRNDISASSMHRRTPDDETVAGTDTVDTAKKGKGNDGKREEKFDILTLSMNTAYNFEADSRRWRDLSLSASTGISILNASFSSSFWFYNEADELTPPTMKSYSVDLTSGRLGVDGSFWDGDLLDLDLTKTGAPTASRGAQSWGIGFSPSLSYRASRSAPSERFVPAKSFNVSSSANVNLTKSLSVQWNGNYDFSSDKFSHNSFDFHYDMECWEMRFSWRPEKINPGFSFVVNVKKIPDIKWEQNENKSTRVL